MRVARRLHDALAEGLARRAVQQKRVPERERLRELERRRARVPVVVLQPQKHAARRQTTARRREHHVLEVRQRALGHQREVAVGGLLRAQDRGDAPRHDVGRRGAGDVAVLRELNHRQQHALEPPARPRGASLRLRLRRRRRGSRGVVEERRARRRIRAGGERLEQRGGLRAEPFQRFVSRNLKLRGAPRALRREVRAGERGGHLGGFLAHGARVARERRVFRRELVDERLLER